MDEREVGARLRGAAESVQASADLVDRAAARYRRRRARGRVVVAAVVVALVGSGVATAVAVGRGHSAPTAVAPSTSERPTPPTSTSGPVAAVGLSNISSWSFVDADVGFALAGAAGEPLERGVVRTGDGGRTWRRVGLLIQAEISVHFENASDGVAYGEGPLQVTTDGGRRWSVPPGGPFHADDLAWQSGRLWSLIPCSVSSPCDSLQVSDDVGAHWHSTAPFRPGFHGASVLAVSRSSALVAGVPPFSTFVNGAPVQSGSSLLAVTVDGGSSWRYESTPCGPLNPQLAFNGRVLLLACAEAEGASQGFTVYTSSDDGGHWSSPVRDPFVDGYFGTLTNVGSNFVAAMDRGGVWSSADGKTWHQEIATPGGAGPWLFDRVEGVGAWAVILSGTNNGIWFSADGVHWEQRAGAAVASTSTTVAPSDRVDVGAIQSLSFVNARVGFGLIFLPGGQAERLVRSDDGGRTWRQAAVLDDTDIHFETAADGLAWGGGGGLQVTTDGGVRWRAPVGGPSGAFNLAWSGGRIWAVPFCAYKPCATTRAWISDDVGLHWRETPSFRADGGVSSVLATSTSTAYVASAPGSPVLSQLAVTHDAGASWAYAPIPCSGTPYLARSTSVLLLVCVFEGGEGSEPKSVWASGDDGRTWQEVAQSPSLGGTPPVTTSAPVTLAVRGNVVSVTSVGEAFVIAENRGSPMVSVDGGRSWKEAIAMGDGFSVIDSVPRVGLFLASGHASENAGMWFSADGVHWQRRAAAAGP